MFTSIALDLYYNHKYFFMEKQNKQSCKKLIRFEIENNDGKLAPHQMENIISDFTLFTHELQAKYNIPADRFKITVGKSIFDSIF